MYLMRGVCVSGHEYRVEMRGNTLGNITLLRMASLVVRSWISANFGMVVSRGLAASAVERCSRSPSLSLLSEAARSPAFSVDVMGMNCITNSRWSARRRTKAKRQANTSATQLTPYMFKLLQKYTAGGPFART